jgi:hypothetical protein
MNKIFTSVIIAILFFANLNLYCQSNGWSKPASETKILESLGHQFDLAKLHVWQLNANSLRSAMQPQGIQTRGISKISIPNPEGVMVDVVIEEHSIMEAPLQAKYPNFNTYRVFSADRKRFLGRLGLIGNDFHAFLEGNDGKYMIEKLKDGSDNYTVAYEEQYLCSPLSCEIPEGKLSDTPQITQRSAVGPDVRMYNYRIAMSTTGEGSRAITGSQTPTKSAVMARLVTVLNIVNGFYNLEVAINFTMVANNDKLIFLVPQTDPFSNSDQGKLLVNNQNTRVCNDSIGIGNYDLGHVFTGGCTDGVAGIAGNSSACSTNRRGDGVTCVGTGQGDKQFIETTCHEIGHQFSAGHTFSECSADQLNPDGAIEMGSGVTNMSYCGLCVCNVGAAFQACDPVWFHSYSLLEVYNYSRTGNGANCATISPQINKAPDVIASFKDSLFVPINTPLKLSGTATDPEGKTMTYTWEQIDIKDGICTNEFSAVGPQYRSYKPTTTANIRYMPNLDEVRAGRIRNAVELTPRISREFNFRLIARDNDPIGGAFGFAQRTINSTTSADSFHVNNISGSFTSGLHIPVRWAVRNTDKAPVNSKLVNISLSTNSGQSFNTRLATEVPNNGEAFVLIPANVNTSTARILIESADNIFFQINRNDFSLAPSTAPNASMSIKAGKTCYCVPPDQFLNIDLNSATINGFSDSLTFRVITLPPNATIANTRHRVLAGGTKSIQINLNGVPKGTHTGLIRGYKTVNNVVDSTNFVYSVNVYPTNHSAMAIVSPVNNGITNDAPTLTWAASPNANTYTLELSSTPGFEANNILRRVTGLTVTSWNVPIVLVKGNSYYWRVWPINECGNGPILSSAFSVESLVCKTFTKTGSNNLPGTNGSTVTGTVTVDLVGEVRDVNIRNFVANANPFSRISARLIAPDNSESILYRRVCPISSSSRTSLDDAAAGNFNCNNLSTNIPMRPILPLAFFNGKQANGNWQIRLRVDSLSITGGSLGTFDLEVCVNRPNSTNETILDQNLVQLLPNPADKDINLSIDGSIDFPVELSIFDISGKSLYMQQLNNKIHSVPSENWSPGSYFIQIRTNKGLINKKVIVQH